MDKHKDLPFLWIRPREQATLSVLLGSLLLAIWGSWWLHGGTRGKQILWDRAPSLETHYQVDINRSTVPELAQLPRIGKTLAQRIINWRLQNGPYTSTEQLQHVRGIGSQTLENLLPYLLPIPPAANHDAVSGESKHNS
jgi:competence ComEA-like helix-hairpin-helix protein